MAMPHKTVSPVAKPEKCLGLHLHGPRKKLPRTRSQDIGQWIVDLVGLTKADNVAILVQSPSG
jgi:hypothetical protein